MSKYDIHIPDHSDLYQAILDEFADDIDKIENPYIKQICDDFIYELLIGFDLPQLELGNGRNMVDEGYAEIVLPTYNKIKEGDIIDVSIEDDAVILKIRRPSIYERRARTKFRNIKSVYYSHASERDDE